MVTPVLSALKCLTKKFFSKNAGTSSGFDRKPNRDSELRVPPVFRTRPERGRTKECPVSVILVESKPFQAYACGILRVRLVFCIGRFWRLPGVFECV